MNLEKLFEQQKILRDRINYNESDRFNKLVLALLVELGECANEWRGFKFWSKDQKPRTKLFDEEYDLIHMESIGLDQKNPLLEEYVDGFHFVLEIGLELGLENQKPFSCVVLNNVVDQFNELFYQVSWLNFVNDDTELSDMIGDFYNDLLGNYMNLGKLLGFTWKEIEQAYYAKNEINHERQDNGY